MEKLPKNNEMVTAQIATLPNRVDLLKKTVESLLPQVDILNIMLNGHNITPSFCHKPKITVYHRNNEKGDAEKFFGLKNIEGYIFTCDDDLIYPPDYVETMTKRLAEFGNFVILTNHGRIMQPKPVSSSYADRIAAYHWRNEAKESVQLDIGGTGVMAWDSDCFFPDYNRIDKANMADIWVHGFAKEQGIRIMLCPHPAEWIQYMNPPETIWDYHYLHPEEQTALYNSF